MKKRNLFETLALGIGIAQKPYAVWSLGTKALIYESLDSESSTPEVKTQSPKVLKPSVQGLGFRA